MQKCFYSLNKATNRLNACIELYAVQWNKLTVLEGVPAYCKIKLNGNLPPLTAKIDFFQRGDLTIYGSYT